MYRNLLKKLAASLAAFATGAGVAFVACSCKTKPVKESCLPAPVHQQTNVVQPNECEFKPAEVKEKQSLN